MIVLAASVTLLLLALAMGLAMFRLLRGPSVTDRILALDTLYIDTLALVVVVGVRLNDPVYFELAILIALFGFVGTTALARHLVRGDIIE